MRMQNKLDFIGLANRMKSIVHKAQFLFPNVNLVLSTQKIKPSDVTVTMYDGGITLDRKSVV